MNLSAVWNRLTGGFLQYSDDINSPDRYRLLRRNIVTLMLFVTIIPLTVMAVINHYEYQSGIKKEIVNPLRRLASKTKHTFELFLEECLNIIRFIASSYSFEDFSDKKTLNRIFKNKTIISRPALSCPIKLSINTYCIYIQ